MSTTKFLHLRIPEVDKRILDAAATELGLTTSEYVRLVGSIVSTGVLNVSEMPASLERLSQVLEAYQVLEQQRLQQGLHGLTGEGDEGKT